MTRLDVRAAQRLAAMGIDRWERRPSAVPPEVVAEDIDEARIRLLSGHGEWVLVQKKPWRGEHEALLSDIQALLGADRCRFGQWAEAGQAGVGPAEMQARGVARVLSFGPPIEPLDWSNLIEVPALDALASDAEARRELWRRLAPALSD